MHRSIRIAAVVVIALALGGLFFAAAGGSPVHAQQAKTYIVLYKANGVPADAAAKIAKAGGTLVYKYDAIGVAIATSDSATFRSGLLGDTRVEGASATENFGTSLLETAEDEDASGDTLDGFFPPNFTYQWDMNMVSLPQAHAINLGNPDLVVGDIDTGLDYTHPALAPNVDFSRSVSCVGGVPNQDPAAWKDDHGHGTHTAGTIAARPFVSGSYNIVGMAPNVKIAGIKASVAPSQGAFFYPEAVVCSFMWAADHGIAVTNNSYYADPWMYNCRNDADQRAIWKAEQRAIRYAISKGVVVVAAMGNNYQDLTKTNIDNTSPDDGTIVSREVTNACAIVPVDVAGVIGVSAVTSTKAKASYSNWGLGVVSVAAPGSSVRSTRRGGGTTSMSGTSMASPHVAGLAALVLSQYGRIPPGSVTALIQNAAVPQPCPLNSTTCEVDPDNPNVNGFYGHGIINAFNAVTIK